MLALSHQCECVSTQLISITEERLETGYSIEGLQNLGLCSTPAAILVGRDLYRATPTVTRASVFEASSQGPPEFPRIIRQARGIEDLF